MKSKYYTDIKQVPASRRILDGAALTLEQINSIHDAARAENNINAEAFAVQQFKSSHRVQNGKWIESDKENPIKFEFSGLPFFDVDDDEPDAPPTSGRGANGCTWERNDPTADFAYPTYNIRNVEVFRTGTYTDSSGKEFNCKPEHLEAMVNNSRTDGIHMNFGHETPDARMPAIGWMENLRTNGESLYADLCRLDPFVFGDIASGAYRKRSLEIIGGMSAKSEVVGCALVGRWQSALPLKDCFSATRPDSQIFMFTTSANDAVDSNKNNTKGSENIMDEKLIQKYEGEISTLKDEIAKLKAEIGECTAKFAAVDGEKSDFAVKVKDLTVENETLKTKISEYEAQIVAKDCDAFFATNSKKFTPAELDGSKATYMALVDKPEALAVYRKSIEARADHPAIAGDTGKDAGNDGVDDINAELQKYAAEHKLDLENAEDFKRAYVAVGKYEVPATL